MREIMWSNNNIDSEDSEETSINKTWDITNLELARIEMTRTPGKIYTDQNRRLPVTSIEGTKYVFVLYCYDGNSIITETFKYSTGQEKKF